MWNSIIGLLALVSCVWVIYDVATNQKKMDTGKKVVWIICALLFSIITAVVYYLLVKKS